MRTSKKQLEKILPKFDYFFAKWDKNVTEGGQPILIDTLKVVISFLKKSSWVPNFPESYVEIAKKYFEFFKNEAKKEQVLTPGEQKIAKEIDNIFKEILKNNIR